MLRQNSYSRRLWVGALAAVTVGLVGCGDSGRPKTIPISGRVTIDGKPPGESGSLFFTPTEAADGYSKRPASGTFLADGSYRVMSWKPDDGLVPGHYKVNFLPGDPTKSAIPGRYQKSETSGLAVDVSVDVSPIEYNIELVTE
jgi:hypothetical protein